MFLFIPQPLLYVPKFSLPFEIFHFSPYTFKFVQKMSFETFLLSRMNLFPSNSQMAKSFLFKLKSIRIKTILKHGVKVEDLNEIFKKIKDHFET
jgi:hypothetical protein